MGTPGLPGAGKEEGTSVKADTALTDHGTEAGVTLQLEDRGYLSPVIF